jgi:hypothetical protein
MNLMVEQVARQKCAELYDPDHVAVRVKTSWRLGFCLPDEKGEDEQTAVFSTMTFGDNYAIEKATTYEVELGRQLGSGKMVTAHVLDSNEYNRLIVKRSLLEWSLDIPIARDRTGWMTPECYARVSRVPAPLLAAFVSEFEESVLISDEEEERISRQCVSLFSKNGAGVADACEAVSRFCTLGNFSEKFGINREALPRMPYREFLMLKMMIGKESDALRVQRAPSRSTSEVSGPGGKMRQSHGVRIPLPGSEGAR